MFPCVNHYKGPLILVSILIELNYRAANILRKILIYIINFNFFSWIPSVPHLLRTQKL